MKKRGTLFVISSPSGGGKSTIISHLLDQEDNLYYSVSATTRKPRKGEKDGDDYHFITREEFEAKIKNNEFIEWAEVHNNLYGTLKSEIDKALEKGRNVILDIDVQGGESIKKIIPDSVLIFLMPPSIEVLENRLKKRGTESELSLKQRLKAAKHEIKYADKYDFQVINNKLEDTVNEVKTIIKHFS